MITSPPPRPKGRGSYLQDAGSYTLSSGIDLHNLAVKGDRKATQEAHTVLKRLHELNPDDAVTEAYFGSIMTLMGRDAIDPNERFAQAMRGLKTLDHAVAKAPDHAEIRTLRGYICLHLPEEYFHRSRTAVEDFAHLARLYENGCEGICEKYYHQVLFNLGKAHRKAGNAPAAQEAWNKLLAVAKDGKYQDLIRQEKEASYPF